MQKFKTLIQFFTNPWMILLYNYNLTLKFTQILLNAIEGYWKSIFVREEELAAIITSLSMVSIHGSDHLKAKGLVLSYKLLTIY